MLPITIDEEFQSLLPRLDEEDYRSLERSLIQYGCLDALVTWNGILMVFADVRFCITGPTRSNTRDFQSWDKNS